MQTSDISFILFKTVRCEINLKRKFSSILHRDLSPAAYKNNQIVLIAIRPIGNSSLTVKQLFNFCLKSFDIEEIRQYEDHNNKLFRH